MNIKPAVSNIRLPAIIAVLILCSACASKIMPVPPRSAIPNGTATLTITLVGSADATGSVHLALHASDAQWLNHPSYTAKATIRNGIARFVFQRVPYGIYAASVYLDSNGNGKFDTGMFHIPIENVGFSNEASGSFGPPSFGAARFVLKTSTLDIKFHLS